MQLLAHVGCVLECMLVDVCVYVGMPHGQCHHWRWCMPTIEWMCAHKSPTLTLSVNKSSVGV